jgi:hypothetical protein
LSISAREGAGEARSASVGNNDIVAGAHARGLGCELEVDHRVDDPGRHTPFDVHQIVDLETAVDADRLVGADNLADALSSSPNDSSSRS